MSYLSSKQRPSDTFVADLTDMQTHIPWMWSTCGMRNTTDEIRSVIKDHNELYDDHQENGQRRPTSRGARILENAAATRVFKAQFPWFLFMFIAFKTEDVNNDEWNVFPACSASLISRYHGLSAAHCCLHMHLYVLAGMVKMAYNRTVNIADAYTVDGVRYWRHVERCDRYPSFRIDKYPDKNRPQNQIDVSVLTWYEPYELTMHKNELILINTICVDYVDVVPPLGSRFEFAGAGGSDGELFWGPLTYEKYDDRKQACVVDFEYAFTFQFCYQIKDGSFHTANGTHPEQVHI